MDQETLNSLVEAIQALAVRPHEQSRTVRILKEIAYIPEFGGQSEKLTQFINVVENHISATRIEERPEIWQAIYNTKVTGRAKELLIHNISTTWEAAKNLLKQHFRPTISYKEIANKITYLKVSSILDLNNKIEFLIQDINTFATYENNPREVKSNLYVLISNKVKQLAIGNLSRDIRDIYDIHKIKEILYSFVGYDEGNIQTDFKTNRQFDQRNNYSRTQNRSNDYRNTSRQNNSQLNSNSSGQLNTSGQNRHSNPFRQQTNSYQPNSYSPEQFRNTSGQYRNGNLSRQNNTQPVFNPSGQIRNAVQNPTPMSVNQTQNEQIAMREEEIHNVDQFFLI